MSQALRLIGRRRPTLRVVGEAANAARHEAVVVVCGFERVLQVWTFAEWDRLTAAERPKNGRILPGIGVWHLRKPKDKDETDDIHDVARQAIAAYEAERDID